MKRITWMIAAAFAVAMVAPVHAGDYKCSESAEACLAQFAKKADKMGWVGIELDRNEDSGLLTVTRVVEKSPAEKAGFKKGDILFALNGVELNEANKEKLSAARGEWTPGAEVVYTVKRAKKDAKLTVTLAEMPREVLAQMVGGHMLESHTAVAVAQE